MVQVETCLNTLYIAWTGTVFSSFSICLNLYTAGCSFILRFSFLKRPSKPSGRFIFMFERFVFLQHNSLNSERQLSLQNLKSPLSMSFKLRLKKFGFKVN